MGQQVIDGRLRLSREERDLIAASAEGYSFPTNLDSDPPVDGMAPETPQRLVERALADSWSQERFNQALDQLYARRQP